ncbi:MAG: hypothetical protein A3J93_01955 [Candidatus Magasanikbacteria bacterium RIFOXYC2_FULL_42_28]|uniref:Disulfide bond formation protein DsbB n=1 Tax=Candidatus Magasanikbacteria bacterium RIFOXYC2_FULL_42_28 TaxID=1798704 RepID=A0A1F6NWI4_9BACT|nr:MAG: hypothetical protein A3J93_01955 [Candidatus Magasanikbacteria bacterium RIFOXYC2_FULL_42_28]
MFWPNHKYRELIRKYAPHLALVAVTIATLGSLFYSEIAGYEPCKLCWAQRIFMYPQVILLITAFAKKRAGAMLAYTLPLSVIGGLIAIYHYLLQLGVVSGVACGVVGYSVSCAQKFVLTYGYITIPLMAVTAFGLSVVAYFANKK